MQTNPGTRSFHLRTEWRRMPSDAGCARVAHVVVQGGESASYAWRRHVLERPDDIDASLVHYFRRA
jgi:hypothetical protein